MTTPKQIQLKAEQRREEKRRKAYLERKPKQGCLSALFAWLFGKK